MEPNTIEKMVVLGSALVQPRESAPKYTKPWGEATALVDSEQVQVDLIQIKSGGFSSLHEHRCKNNLFIVKEGQLRVTLFERHGGRFEEGSVFTLTPEVSVLLVFAQRVHQFLCLSDCVAYEVYWSQSSEPVHREDIIRYRPNGILSQTNRTLPK